MINKRTAYNCNHRADRNLLEEGIAIFPKGSHWIIVLTIGLLGWFYPAHAELSLQNDRLSVRVQEAPLEGVLRELSKLGAFEITLLENLTIERKRYLPALMSFHLKKLSTGS